MNYQLTKTDKTAGIFFFFFFRNYCEQKETNKLLCLKFAETKNKMLVSLLPFSYMELISQIDAHLYEKPW